MREGAGANQQPHILHLAPLLVMSLCAQPNSSTQVLAEEGSPLVDVDVSAAERRVRRRVTQFNRLRVSESRHGRHVWHGQYPDSTASDGATTMSTGRVEHVSQEWVETNFKPFFGARAGTETI